MAATQRAALQGARPYRWPDLDETAEPTEPEFIAVSLHQVVSPDEVGRAPLHEAAGDDEGQAGGEQALAAVRRQAEQIRTEACRQAAAEARERLEQALRAAMEEHTAAFQQARERLLQELRAAYQQSLSEIEQEMLSTIAVMAEKVIRRKLETDDDIVLGVVREALSQAAGANQVTVRVSPADEPLVREAQQQLLAAAGPVDGLQIVVDEQVLRGGCLVETERGRFDARVDSQLRLLSDEVDRLLADANVRKAG
jgi:flagellar biosynthesis/type III secretory pathway protein FliH